MRLYLGTCSDTFTLHATSVQFRVCLPAQVHIGTFVGKSILCVFFFPRFNLQVLSGSHSGSPGDGGRVSSCSGLHTAELHLPLLL